MSDARHHLPHVARHFWGEPNKELSAPGVELRFGTHGSKSVDLKKLVWFDSETQKGGTVVDLLEHEEGLRGHDRYWWLEERGWGSDDDDAPAKNGSAPRAAGVPARAFPKEVARYTYTDESRQPLFQVRRKEYPAQNGAKPDKTFVQYRPDGQGDWIIGVKGHGIRRVPYRLPELIEAVAEGGTIFIAEGEKKVDALWAIGLPATCNVGGAKSWKGEDSAFFHGADVVLLPDNDQAGRDHVALVGSKLAPVVKSLRVLELPGLGPKGDIVDWVKADRRNNKERFESLLEDECRPYDEWVKDRGTEAKPSKKKELTQAQVLIALAREHCEFFHVPHSDNAYADVEVGSPADQSLLRPFLNLSEPRSNMSGPSRMVGQADASLPRVSAAVSGETSPNRLKLLDCVGVSPADYTGGAR